MRIDLFLARDMSQPKEERKWSSRQVIGQSLGGFEKGFLEDIRLVDTSLDWGVESQAYRIRLSRFR